MVSLVVCSIDEKLLQAFRLNVAATIGVDYEIIAIDNTIQKKSLCEIYNMGLAKTRFPVICFCHEDIRFETNNWGTLLGKTLANDAIGLVGICGTTYKSKYPTTWSMVPVKYYRCNMVQVNKEGKEEYKPLLDNGDYSPVAVLDGCFIAGRKEIFNEFNWNESLLKGFHLYDMDISLRVLSKYKIVVSNLIRICHFSLGSTDKNWLLESEKFHEAYKNILPVSIYPISKKDKGEADYYSLLVYIVYQIKFRRKRIIILKNIIGLFGIMPFKRANLALLKRCILLR